MAVRTNPIWSSPAEPDQLQPFRIRGGTPGCPLVHGFARTPPAMPAVACAPGAPSSFRLLPSYARRPAVGIESLLQVLRVVDRELPTISAPALIVHGRNDRTVDVANAPHIMRRIGSVDKQLVWFERSGHTVTVDLEHDALYAMVRDWLTAH